MKITWSQRAKNELDETCYFWINKNKAQTYSNKILDETFRKIAIIKENPKIGMESRSKNLRRVLVLDNFSLTYRLSKNNIHIVSFFDNRRNSNQL